MTVFESMLNKTATIERRTRTADDQGGWTITYNEVGSVDCRVSPKSSKERLVADSDEAQITHVLYCLADEDIARGDIATVDSLELEIIAIREPSQASEHWEIDAMERQSEEVASS